MWSLDLFLTNMHISLSFKAPFNIIINNILWRIHDGHNGRNQGSTSTTSYNNIHSNSNALNLQHKIRSKYNVISTYVIPSTDNESIFKNEKFYDYILLQTKYMVFKSLCTVGWKSRSYKLILKQVKI